MGRGIAIDANAMRRGIAINDSITGRGINIDANTTRSALATVETKSANDAGTMWRAGKAVSTEITLAAFKSCLANPNS